MKFLNKIPASAAAAVVFCVLLFASLVEDSRAQDCGALYQCEGTTECISKRYTCDGCTDCPLGEDEGPELCANSTKYPWRFQCKDGTCMSASVRCDPYHDIDCADGSDEEDCPTPGPPPPCYDYQCPNSDICLSFVWTCNNLVECPGGEDEENCEECGSYMFKCGSGECLWNEHRCDTRKDCADGSDEIVGCPPRPPGGCWPWDEIQCSNGDCINRKDQCNNNIDCADGSDEGFDVCPCDEGLGGGFRCDLSRCVQYYQVCDGATECNDFTDERNCPCRNDDYVWCANEVLCINPEWICDYVPDCPDGSDEGDFCEYSNNPRILNGTWQELKEQEKLQYKNGAQAAANKELVVQSKK